MSDTFVLDIIAKNQRHDDKLLIKLAATSKETRQKAFELAATATVEELNAQEWTGDCAREFATAALANEPFKAYHANEKNKISNESFGGGTGLITARSLLLGRFTSFENDRFYGADNCMTSLDLSHDNLTELGSTQAKLLDVGCGYSIFGAEAGLFGIEVEGVDQMQNDLGRKDEVFKQYAKNLVFACTK